MRLFLTMRKNTARKIRAKAIEIKGGFHYQTKTQCVPTPPPRCNYIWYLGWTLQAVQRTLKARGVLDGLDGADYRPPACQHFICPLLVPLAHTCRPPKTKCVAVRGGLCFSIQNPSRFPPFSGLARPPGRLVALSGCALILHSLICF